MTNIKNMEQKKIIKDDRNFEKYWSKRTKNKRTPWLRKYYRPDWQRYSSMKDNFYHYEAFTIDG